MRIAIFPGSFDPITLGHLNIIERASRLFDKVIVCAVINGEKKNPMFTPEQRLELLKVSTEHLDNVEAAMWQGLMTDFARDCGAVTVVRGTRCGSNFDDEYAMAQIYSSLCPGLDMVVIPAKPELAHISSTMVREMVKYGQPLEKYMPLKAAELVKGWKNNG